MKWIALLLIFAAIQPLSAWLRRNPAYRMRAWTVLGLMPFLITVAHLVMAARLVDAITQYHTQGLEFSALDALAMALYFSQPREGNRIPFRIEMSLYFIAVIIAIPQSFSVEFSLYYPWQLLRMYFVYMVVATASAADARVVKAILQGMAIGLCCQAPISILQRLSGVLQASGTFDHQNILGLVSHFVVLPYFAAFLEGWWGVIPALVVVSGVVVQVLTASRATLGLATTGYCLVYVLSIFTSFSPRKMRVLGAAVAVLVVVVPIALSSIEGRGGAEIEGSDEARGSMERAAGMMLDDHPLGVGPNTYIQMANMGGYNAAARVDYTSWVVFVHNAYWVVAVETGYLGAITFILMLLRPVFVAFLCGFRNRKDSRGVLLLGLAVALLVVEVHGLFEWVMIKSIVQYMFALEFGMVAGLAMQLGYWRRAGGKIAGAR
ncbi:O-antigen ligase family protein [Bradyrhizobium genosp. A]|uniref:O-antigen ligase family protein n=1 Tax=Bradyrhizobium genosp. A TaxID=83626 RepID=UPI003CF99123